MRCVFVLWPLPSSQDSSLLDGYPELMVSFHPCSLPTIHPSSFPSIHSSSTHNQIQAGAHSYARAVRKISSRIVSREDWLHCLHMENTLPSPFFHSPTTLELARFSLGLLPSPSPLMSQGSSTELYHPTTFDGPHNPFVYFRRLSESLNLKWAGVKGYQTPTLLDHWDQRLVLKNPCPLGLTEAEFRAHISPVYVQS